MDADTPTFDGMPSGGHGRRSSAPNTAASGNAKVPIRDLTPPNPLEVADAVSVALRAAANATVPGPMRAYMKHLFPFFGIATPRRRLIGCEVLDLAGCARRTAYEIDEAWLAAFTRDLWQRDEREHQYAALDTLAIHQRRLGPSFVTEVAAELVVDKAWWDSVDGMQSAVIGPVVARNPVLISAVRTWLESPRIDRRPNGCFSPELALVRAALIHQLGRGETVDQALLFEFCAARATDREFFVAKAVGWALRDYSYTDPAAVEQFVASHPELTPLAQREALKAIRAGSVARRNGRGSYGAPIAGSRHREPPTPAAAGARLLRCGDG